MKTAQMVAAILGLLGFLLFGLAASGALTDRPTDKNILATIGYVVFIISGATAWLIDPTRNRLRLVGWAFDRPRDRIRLVTQVAIVVYTVAIAFWLGLGDWQGALEALMRARGLWVAGVLPALAVLYWTRQ